MIEKFLKKIVNADEDTYIISLFGKAYVWKYGEYMGVHKK